MLGLLLGGGSHGARLAGRGPVYFLGLDVGQKRDPSALAVVERSEVETGEVSRVTFERVRVVRQVVRWAEAMPLKSEREHQPRKSKSELIYQLWDGRALRKTL